MTINDAYNDLLQFFSRHDDLDLDRDFLEIRKVSANPELDKGIYRVVLREMAEKKVIYRVLLKDGASEYWVLKMPLEILEQTVTFSGDDVMLIMKCAIQFKAIMRLDDYSPNPLRMTSSDVIRVIETMGHIIARGSERID